MTVVHADSSMQHLAEFPHERWLPPPEELVTIADYNFEVCPDIEYKTNSGAVLSNFTQEVWPNVEVDVVKRVLHAFIRSQAGCLWELATYTWSVDRLVKIAESRTDEDPNIPGGYARTRRAFVRGVWRIVERRTGGCAELME